MGVGYRRKTHARADHGDQIHRCPQCYHIHRLKKRIQNGVMREMRRILSAAMEEPDVRALHTQNIS